MIEKFLRVRLGKLFLYFLIKGIAQGIFDREFSNDSFGEIVFENFLTKGNVWNIFDKKFSKNLFGKWFFENFLTKRII